LDDAARIIDAAAEHSSKYSGLQETKARVLVRARYGGATMTRRKDVLRGLRESRTAVLTLQQHWPAAFPTKAHLTRPLASGIIPVIAASTGWSAAYTRGVLLGWKRRAAYCQSVLREQYRYDLDGVASLQCVDDGARAQAMEQLARMRQAELRRLEKKKAAAPDQIPSDLITAPCLQRVG
jgi:sRNA-binding protein